MFIGRNIRESWVRALIELLDAEVAAETAKRDLLKVPGVKQLHLSRL